MRQRWNPSLLRGESHYASHIGIVTKMLSVSTHLMLLNQTHPISIILPTLYPSFKLIMSVV